MGVGFVWLVIGARSPINGRDVGSSCGPCSLAVVLMVIVGIIVFVVVVPR